MVKNPTSKNALWYQLPRTNVKVGSILVLAVAFVSVSPVTCEWLQRRFYLRIVTYLGHSFCCEIPELIMSDGW